MFFVFLPELISSKVSSRTPVVPSTAARPLIVSASLRWDHELVACVERPSFLPFFFLFCLHQIVGRDVRPVQEISSKNKRIFSLPLLHFLIPLLHEEEEVRFVCAVLLGMDLAGDELSFTESGPTGADTDTLERRSSVPDLDFGLEPYSHLGSHPHHGDAASVHVELGAVCGRCHELEEQLKTSEKAKEKLKANLKKTKETIADTGKLVALFKDVEKGQ